MNQSFFTRRSFLIIMVVLFLLPLIWAGTRRALRSNTNDVKDWLPDGFEETAEHTWFQKHFPHEQFVLISWKGRTSDDPGCALDDHRLEFFARKLVPLERPSGAEEPMVSSGQLVPSGNPAVARLPGDDVKQSPEEPRLFKSVLTGPRLIKELQDRYEDLSEEEILERLEGSLIGKDHYKTCLVVTLTDAAKGRQLRPTLEEIRRIAEDECDIRRDEIRLGGPPVDNVAIDIEGERTLYRLAGLSAIVGLGISMLCFRSLRLTAIVFSTAILAAGVGLAMVYFTGSTCDAIVLSMPSLVYVLAISGTIHIINYYRDAIREQDGLLGAPERALAHGWFPCTLAAVTTALGLGTLMISHVVPISKFGLYSALGVLATLALLFLYVPALLYYFPSRKYAQKHAGEGNTELEATIFLRWWRMAGGFIIRHNIAVSLGCAAVMVFFAFGLTRVETSVKLMKLFSPEAEIITHYQWLENHLGPLVPMEVVIAVDNEECDLTFVERMRLAQEIEHAIEEGLPDDVGGALSAATFAPDISPYKGRGIGSSMRRAMYESGLSRRLEKHRDDFREYLTVDADRLETDDPTLKHLRISVPIARKLRTAKLDTLDAVEEHGDLTFVEGIGPEEAAHVTAAIEAWKSVRNPSLEQLGITGRVADVLTSRELTTLKAIQRRRSLASIEGVGAEEAAQAADAVKAWKTAHGQELWRVSARVWALTDIDYALFVDELKSVVEPVIEAHRAKGVKGIDAHYTGLIPLVYKTQHELMRGLVNSLAVAFGLIAIVMIVVLRSPSAGLLSMIPNVFPVVVIFGMMGWLGILVDIGSMMTASVALGVAVDDTMHYLTWFRNGLDRGLNRKGAAMAAYERCGTAMTQTTLVGGLGLAVFVFSTFTPTQRFGTLMLVLLFAALFGDLVFLPALLTGPLGHFFGRRRKKRLRRDPSKEDTYDTVLVPMEGKAGTLHSHRDPLRRSNKAS